jgi:phosphatidylglycerol lysyltransferase
MSRSSHINRFSRHFRVTRRFAARSISLLVGAHGVFILADSLLEQLNIHHGMRLISRLVVDIPLLIGLSLIYLGSLLQRRKYTAWLVTVLAYVFYFGLSINPLLADISQDRLSLLTVVRSVILPAVVLSLLIIFRLDFVVRSDRQGFRSAYRFALLVLLIALAYGTTGFLLLDKSDFHHELTLGSAIHYTIDQFDLTTIHPIRPYTLRAKLFVDSLSFVSTAAVIYAVVSFFQPLRLRLSDQSANRERTHELLRKHGAQSEDYFFDAEQRSGLAYHVWRGVAVCLGDPAGDHKRWPALLDEFGEVCYQNDWLPVLVHIQDTNRALYERRGFSLQKLGQEAVVNLEHFQSEVVGGKYFRQINNKFTKQGYSAELLTPPHHTAVINRLRDISNDWLKHGGHEERGFAMGYFSEAYMQACPVMVVRDAAGTIQAFLNQLPADFDSTEATYDLLRYTRSSLGNSNDYLLMQFASILQKEGYQRLNLGLCPLTGLDEPDDDSTGLIHTFLRFAYANGDRLYSFSGLYRFKSKYQPEWRDRYVAYQGGVRGFSRSMTALMRTMRVKS